MSRYRDDRDDERYDRRPAPDDRGGDRHAPPPPRDDRYGRAGYDVRENYYRRDYESGAVGHGGERSDYESRDPRAPRYEDEPPPPPRRPRSDDYEGERGYAPTPPPPPRFRPEERRGGASRSHVRCRDIMTRDVTVATRDTTLRELAAMMRDEDTGVIPVVERADAAAATDATESSATNRVPTRRSGGAGAQGNGRLVGLITDRDVVVRAIAEGLDAETTRAEAIMTTDVHTAQPNDRVIEAIRKMGDKQVRRIPVVDRERVLRGIISMADVALETNDDRELAEALEEISSGSSFWNRVFG